MRKRGKKRKGGAGVHIQIQRQESCWFTRRLPYGSTSTSAVDIHGRDKSFQVNWGNHGAHVALQATPQASTPMVQYTGMLL